MNRRTRIELGGLGTELEVNCGTPLMSVLAAQGVEFPCGGSGVCGGCRVRILAGTLAPTSADYEYFTPAELAAGWRLACHALVGGPLKLDVGQWKTPVLADEASGHASKRKGLGIAVDVGTTTLAAQIIDLGTGELLGVRTALNPQVPYAADVMSRVRLSMDHADLTSIIRKHVGAMITEVAKGREAEVLEIVLVGNTVMHHLFCDFDVEPLSHVPFASGTLDEQALNPGDLGWPLCDRTRVRFLRCIGGFVGSDVLAGIVAVGLQESRQVSVLLDLGTNGEIVVGNRERLLCASTAAGPAFEAASISCGMRAATGAINKVTARSGQLHCDVIGGGSPQGVCGSGLVDAAAAGLDAGLILPSGRLANGRRSMALTESVSLTQGDVRELQLAKGAVAAGLRILLRRWGASMKDVQSVYLAGAFGNYIHVGSAVRIGLLDADSAHVVAAGNTALRGAKLLLCESSQPSWPRIEHVSLASDPGFQDTFAECMPFPPH